MVWFMVLKARGFSFNYAGSKKMSVSYKAKLNYLSVIGKRKKLEHNGLNKKLFLSTQINKRSQHQTHNFSRARLLVHDNR